MTGLQPYPFALTQRLEPRAKSRLKPMLALTCMARAPLASAMMVLYSLPLGLVLAQAPLVPLAGKWAIEINQTGLPLGGGGVSKVSACLGADDLSAAKDRAFMKAAMASHSRAPTCTYDYATQTPESATWQMICKGGPVTLSGKGVSRWGQDQYSVEETLKGNSPFGGELNIKSTLQAKRTGDC